MIYGIVPIGGKGTRLGLPFSKEMLPQINFDFYNPVSNHLISKMLRAGAQKIVFVHGKTFKNDVISYFSDSIFLHVKEIRPGFAQVIEAAAKSIRFEAEDVFYFGMPDTIFQGNPFIEMRHKPGIVCAIFKTDPNTKVDRLTCDFLQFTIKSEKTINNLDYFWGLIKFDGFNILSFLRDGVFEKVFEVGAVLNEYPFTTVQAGQFIDLGTWKNYNSYLSGGFEIDFSVNESDDL